MVILMNSIGIVDYRINEIKQNNNQFTIIHKDELLQIRKTLKISKRAVELAVIEGKIECPFLATKTEEDSSTEIMCPKDRNCLLCKVLDIYHRASKMLEKEDNK